MRDGFYLPNRMLAIAILPEGYCVRTSGLYFKAGRLGVVIKHLYGF